MLLYGGTVTYGDERRLTKYLSNLVKQIFRLHTAEPLNSTYQFNAITFYLSQMFMLLIIDF